MGTVGGEWGGGVGGLGTPLRMGGGSDHLPPSRVFKMYVEPWSQAWDYIPKQALAQPKSGRRKKGCGVAGVAELKEVTPPSSPVLTRRMASDRRLAGFLPRRRNAVDLETGFEPQSEDVA